jgi:RHS repeat-associated protein
MVNLAGGNFLHSRVDLSIDTQMGTQTVGATYNSQTGLWLWDFDISYDGTILRDATGAEYDVSAVADGEAIPGSVWVKVNSERLQTKGGLEHIFDAVTGRLLSIRWTSSLYQDPRLVFVQGTVAGEPHTTAIQSCTWDFGCSDLFTIDYDAVSGAVLAITDRTGRVADFAYDAQGRLETARDALDIAELWSGTGYEYSGTLLTAIETEVATSEYRRTEIDYDGMRRATAIRPIGEENPVYQLSYQPPTSGVYSTTLTDPLGFRTIFQYDSQRRLTQLERVDVAETTQWQWSGVRPVSMTLPSGVTTEWTYLDDDVATVTLPSTNVVRFTYMQAGVNPEDPYSRPILRIEDDLGVVEERTYGPGPNGFLTSVTNGAAETTTIDYFEYSKMIYSITSPAGTVVYFDDYGEDGHPLTVTQGDDELTYAYDAVGNLTEGNSFSSDSAPGWGGIISRAFDANRNPSEVLLQNQDWIPASYYELETLAISHRADGRRSQISRPYGGDTQFVYDALGRLVERREIASGVGHDGWQSTYYYYDGASRLRRVVRPNGMEESWAFDPAGRVEQHWILRGGAVESIAVYEYADGRLASVLDSVHGSAPEVYSYDAAGRVASIEYPDGELLWLAYDLRSRVVASTFLLEDLTVVRNMTYEYDGADRETAVREDGNLILARTYQDGQLERVEYGSGLEREITYDADNGMIESATTRFAIGGAPVEETALSRDLDCGLSLLCFGVVTQTYGTVAEITSEQYYLGQNEGASSEPGDQFLKAGPRIYYYRTESGSPASIYEFDLLANLDAIVTPRCGDGTQSPDFRTFSYNPERNRLLSVDDPGCGTSHQYAYDAAGFVVTRDGQNIEWDGAGRITEVGSDASFLWDTQGRPVSRTVMGIETRYLFGGAVEADPSGNPTAIESAEVRIDLVTGEHLYRHHDFRGNVKFATDDAGDVVRHVHYDPYGVNQVFSSEDDPFGFAQGRDIGGLILLGHRLYEPGTGRFLAPDPIYQLINQYSYAMGNPVGFWDPGGLFASPAPPQPAFTMSPACEASLTAVAAGVLATAAGIRSGDPFATVGGIVTTVGAGRYAAHVCFPAPSPNDAGSSPSPSPGGSTLESSNQTTSSSSGAGKSKGGYPLPTWRSSKTWMRWKGKPYFSTGPSPAGCNLPPGGCGVGPGLLLLLPWLALRQRRLRRSGRTGR